MLKLLISMRDVKWESVLFDKEIGSQIYGDARKHSKPNSTMKDFRASASIKKRIPPQKERNLESKSIFD